MLTFLLALADERDQERVTELYNRYHTEMYKIAMYKLGRRPNALDEAEEAVQNAFVKIIEHFDSIRFDEGEKAIHAYVLTIVANESINIIRKQNDMVSLENIDTELKIPDDFVEQMCMLYEYEDVVQAIMALDDRYSIPLQLRYAEELSIKEIASTLNMKQKTVYTNLNRGKILLYQSLGKKVQRNA